MNRRHFLSNVSVLSLAHLQESAAGTPQERTDAVLPHIATDRLPLVERYQLTRNRVIHGGFPAYTPDFLLDDIVNSGRRRFTEFSGDVSGRWIGALSVSSAAFGDRFPQLDDVVARVVGHQQPEGYFGKQFNAENPGDNDLALLWGNGRLLVGLMEYHALTRNVEVLRAAVRLGEFLLAIGPVFNSKKMADEFGASHFSSSYICWTQQTEGLAALYEATADRRFAALCEAISERMERRPGDHVHGYLCSLRGTLDLYRATHNPVLLKRVEEAWSDIVESGDVLLTGGVPEAWSPKKLRTEGCAECDWLRLNLGLWRATADPRYIEMAERVYFNDFCQNQFATGDFGHAELTNLGVPGTVAVKAWWCCTLHGMHAFSDIRRQVLIRSGSDVLYSLPLDAQVQDDDLELKAYSDLAVTGTTKIVVSKAPPKQTLTVRRPSWADVLTLRVNDVHKNGNQTIEIAAGDRIDIKYDLTERRLQAGSIGRLAKRSAFFVGPWLLGSSSLINVNYFNELHAQNQIDPLLGPPNNPELSSPFAVPIAARSASYLPAEYPTQPARTELRAVAEQTAGSPARWEMAFATIPSRG